MTAEQVYRSSKADVGESTSATRPIFWRETAAPRHSGRFCSAEAICFPAASGNSVDRQDLQPERVKYIATVSGLIPRRTPTSRHDPSASQADNRILEINEKTGKPSTSRASARQLRPELMNAG
jgi:hypothetical protein